MPLAGKELVEGDDTGEILKDLGAIEGEALDRDSVRSSLLQLIGIEAASPNSDEKAAGAAALMVDVREKWRHAAGRGLLS
jgi:hypothetical protein